MAPLFDARHERQLKHPFMHRSSALRYKPCKDRRGRTPHSRTMAMQRHTASFLHRRSLTGLAALALAAATLASWTTPSGAGDSDHELARRALQQGQVLPLRTVLDQVEREHQGQVIKVEFEQDDGRFIYEIRLLQSGGRVAKLKIDARDGKVLSLKRKD